MDASVRRGENADGRNTALTAYRPFIDGLRAVSILVVVLYHVGVPGFAGGYVGVDVFFVISGFLIISQIVEHLEQGRFSLGAFWSRRALRILPPYLLVLAFCVVAAEVSFVMPDEFTDFGRQIGHAALMVVNHYFLIQEGYFDTASDTKVLLHLWSLAVEEQFYLVAPLALAGLWWMLAGAGDRPFRPRLVLWLAAVFAVSLAACIVFTLPPGSRNYAFYLAPLRAWEFVAGGATGLLLPAVRAWPRRALETLAAAGLAAILASATLYSPDTLYPSYHALLPVTGACAVILAGLADDRLLVARVLSIRPMVWIGLLSYSWYLWHWPLLAFGRFLRFGERDLLPDAVLAVAALALAAMSYALVERPIRLLRQRQRTLGWRPAIVGMIVCICVAAGGYLHFDARGSELRNAGAYVTSPSVEIPAFCNLLTAPSWSACTKVAAGRDVMLLMGDSHANAATNGFAVYAAEHDAAVTVAASAGCAALLGAHIFIRDPEMSAKCATLRANLKQVLAPGDSSVEAAVLFSRWPNYGTWSDYRLGVEGSTAPADDQDAVFTAALADTIRFLQTAGIKRILVVGAVPLFKRSVPNCLFLADRNGMDRGQACGVSIEAAAPERELTNRRIGKAIEGMENVRYLDPFDDFCSTGRCLPFAGHEIFYLDTNHLSFAGTMHIIRRHEDDMRWLVGDQD